MFWTNRFPAHVLLYCHKVDELPRAPRARLHAPMPPLVLLVPVRSQNARKWSAIHLLQETLSLCDAHSVMSCDAGLLLKGPTCDRSDAPSPVWPPLSLMLLCMWAPILRLLRDGLGGPAHFNGPGGVAAVELLLTQHRNQLPLICTSQHSLYIWSTFYPACSSFFAAFKQQLFLRVRWSVPIKYLCCWLWVFLCVWCVWVCVALWFRHPYPCLEGFQQRDHIIIGIIIKGA